MNQFIRQRNQLVVAADNISQRTKFVSSSSIYTIQRHGGATELVHKVIDVLDRPNRRVSVTLLRYKVDKRETSYAQIRPFARRKQEGTF